MIREPSSWTITGSALVAVAAASAAIAALVTITEPAPARPVSGAVPIAAVPPPARASTPAVAPVAPPPAPRRADCSVVAAVYFGYGKATLLADAEQALAPIVAFAAGHANTVIQIDGHADPTGDELGNLHLSKRRARAVARELARLGVTSPINERAFGAFVPTGTTDVQAAQRRAEVAIRDTTCEGDTP